MSLAELLTESKKQEAADKSGNSLFCCVLGPSGAGKSHAIGTLGVKTLFLHFVGERHGIDSSKKEGSDNIIPYCLDSDGKKSLDPDETLSRLRAILSDPQGLKDQGFGAIVLDGLTEMDMCISDSKELKKMCLTSQGKVDGFKLTPATKRIASGLMNSLQNIRSKTGIHIIVTCILTVGDTDEEGALLGCIPQLGTYGLAESVLQKFGDRVVVTPLVRDDPDTGKKETIRVFDSRVVSTKVSKDVNGIVKKTSNFSCRLSSGELPKLMKADLSELIKIKEG